MTAAKKIRVMIADSRPVFRTGLRLLCEKESDLQIVGEVDKGDDVLKRVGSLKPQIILLHARLGEANGRSVAQQLSRSHPKTRLMILTSNEQEENQFRALRLTAAQIIPRNAGFRALSQWMRQLDGAIGKLEIPPDARPAADAGAWENGAKDNSPLSSRERQVVELVSQGFKNREIAQRMFISEQTVKNHLHNIFDKLGVSDRLELALYAIHKNLQTSS
jgi:DNA-binding NarL/FixJ family response regulator